MVVVIKKDGQKDPFDPEKIKRSIRLAARQGGLDEAKVGEIVEKISANVIRSAENRKEIMTAEIRSQILSELDAIAPQAAEAWRKYEANKNK